MNGTSATGDLKIPSTVSDGTKGYTVVGIGNGAFTGCSSLTSVTIPGSVINIGYSAFLECGSLTSVTIPDSVTSIGGRAFKDCNSLASITIPNSITIIWDETFMRCKSLTNVIIPDNVTSIEQSAFGACTNLESVTIPEGVTSIGNSAFALCFSLTSVTIPSSVTNIDLNAFCYCHSLESVTILNDNIIIGVNAVPGTGYTFWECPSLKSFRIALSENITGTPAIGNHCFEGCISQSSLTFLTKDGTTELSNTTTPTLAEAVEFYNAVDDGGINDGYWYGWELPEVPDVTGYPVTINVKIDGSVWNDCGKSFVLSADNGGTFITDLTDVSNGTYTIYDITGASDSTGYVNTGVTVEVKDAAAQAEINYYSVTFYDGDTIFAGRIVPNNTKVSVPLPPPTKEGYTFYRWAISEDGSTGFDFNNPITAKTDVYASWIADVEELFTITASAGTGGSVSPSGEVIVKSGADQQFIITPEDGYRIASVLVDGNEVLNSVRTRDYSKAGLTDAGNNVKYYDFENVTGNHTLDAYFETIHTNDNNGPGGSGGDDTGNNNNSGASGGNGTDNNNGSSGSGGNDTGGNNGSGSSDGDTTSDSSTPVINSDTIVIIDADIISDDATVPASKENEPKTGDAFHVEIYATIAMIAGLSYLLLYFADGTNGMTEEKKQELVMILIRWAKKGSYLRRYAALAIIFLILVYYHSIGKRTSVEWKEVYEK